MGNEKPLLEYDIVSDGEDKEYKKFNRTQYMRKIVLRHNIGERVVLDRMRPHDLLAEIEALYSKIVKPVLDKYNSKDVYSVVIQNKKT